MRAARSLRAWRRSSAGRRTVRPCTGTEQRRAATLSPAERRAVKSNPAAWSFFEAQPPHYQRSVALWIQSAKKDETRTRRLATLIDLSARGRMVPPFVPRPKR